MSSSGGERRQGKGTQGNMSDLKEEVRVGLPRTFKQGPQEDGGVSGGNMRQAEETASAKAPRQKREKPGDEVVKGEGR